MSRSFIMNVKKFFDKDTYKFLVQYVSTDRKIKPINMLESKIRSVCAELLVLPCINRVNKKGMACLVEYRNKKF